jgi:hypothetical protein
MHQVPTLEQVGDGPVGLISILCFILGAGIGAGVFFPSHFRYAKKKRAEFVAAGGDPSGITPFMFGARENAENECHEQ